MIIIAGSLSFDRAEGAKVTDVTFGRRNLQRITEATAGFFDASPTAPSAPAAR